MEVAKTHIVIVNFNGHNDTCDCVHSIFQSDYGDFQLLIVDNSETKNSIDHLRTHFQQLNYPFLELSEQQLKNSKTEFSEKILLIKADQNKGFAAANNVALKYLMALPSNINIWLLNNDTLIASDTLKELAHFTAASQKLKLGLIGAKLFNLNNPEILQGIGGKYNPALATTRHIGENERDDGQYDQIDYQKTVDYPIGASLFFSNDFLKSVGLMEEVYFLYFEELDWSVKAKEKGWKLGFCSTAKVWHKEGASINGPAANSSSLLADKCNLVNRVRFTLKFYPYYFPTVLLGILVALFNRLRRGQSERIIPIVKALILQRPI